MASLGLLLLPSQDVVLSKDMSHIMGKRILLRNPKGMLLCGKIAVQTQEQRRSMTRFTSLTMGADVPCETLPLFFVPRCSNVAELELVQLLMEPEPEPEPEPEDTVVGWVSNDFPLSYYVRSVTGYNKLT